MTLTLISDIDNTLTGDSGGLQRFNDFLRARRKEIYLVYATGRSFEFYREVAEGEGLEQPDALILNTGSDIYFRKDGNYFVDGAWHEKIKNDTWDIERINAALSGVGGVAMQEHVYEFKVSYYIDANEQAGARARVVDTLRKNSIRANVVTSHGKYLDILPFGCDKGEAALYFVRKKGLDPGQVVVAGDSENDFDMFYKFNKGIVVNNALKELKDMLKGRGGYFAERSCARGVLEGLKYYLAGC